MTSDSYLSGLFLVGIPTFLGCWVYAIYEYGFFLGVGLGWLPAMFIAVIFGAIWPILLILLTLLFLALIIWLLIPGFFQ